MFCTLSLCLFMDRDALLILTHVFQVGLMQHILHGLMQHILHRRALAQFHMVHQQCPKHSWMKSLCSFPGYLLLHGADLEEYLETSAGIEYAGVGSYDTLAAFHIINAIASPSRSGNTLNMFNWNSFNIDHNNKTLKTCIFSSLSLIHTVN